MARIRRTQKETDDKILELVGTILNDEVVTEDSIAAIENRADILKKIVKNGSRDNWSVEDPGLVSELIGHIVAEYIFSSMDQDEHRDFANELVNTIADSTGSGNNTNSRRTSDRKGSVRTKADVNVYFESLMRYLKNNGFETRPTFALFQKYVSKFNAKKLVEEPEFESDRDAFVKWENFVSKK